MQYISKRAIRYCKTSVTCGASFTVDGILLFQNRHLLYDNRKARINLFHLTYKDNMVHAVHFKTCNQELVLHVVQVLQF